MGKSFELYKYALKNYFNFSGRACRKEILCFMLYYLIFLVIVGIFAALIMPALLNNPETATAIVITILSIVTWLAAMGLFILPAISLSVRRLHDVNMSGWLLLLSLLNFIPIINIAISIGFFVVLYCIKGTDGENKYGPISVNY